jgi:hypothetical protein
LRVTSRGLGDVYKRQIIGVNPYFPLNFEGELSRLFVPLLTVLSYQGLEVNERV